ELAQLLSTAQRSAALLQPKLDLLCATLEAGAADRAAEEEPRWQAGYDLAYGRALAAQVRTAGYHMMLAKAKQGMPFTRERSNTWVLEPSGDFAATSLERRAEEATNSLRRVASDHPGTPWAMLAERELSTPLGWRWDEAFSYLPPREDGGNGGNRPPRRNPPAPEGPPRRNPPPL
ncbi:MAG TPA: VWA domain-containing protein, partial [Lacipirellulaceae bacterium]|nr:VWA domain-containing protein [Lacipirellulaceae bacterium]